MQSPKLKCLIASFAMLMVAGSASAAEKLRILTWQDYVPKDLAAQFTKDTGIEVEVTTSNNEEMISKLRATGGAGFDLAQPSQDRIAGPQKEFGIYKPLDMSKIDSSLFIPSLLEATQKNTAVDGRIYGLPHIWGTDGLVVNAKLAGGVKDYGDLCGQATAGKVSYRLKRPTLIAFAFAMGEDPFKLYADPAAYQALMDKVGDKLIACKKTVKFYWEGKDQLFAGFNSGEVVAAMAWDTGGWKLNAENPDIKFVAPASGAMGWVDTFAIPAKGRNDAAAYAWINYVMRPANAARIAASAGNFTASKDADKLVQGKLKEQFAESFPPAALQKINWYPAVPNGLEAIEGKVLDRVKAAN